MYCVYAAPSISCSEDMTIGGRRAVAERRICHLRDLWDPLAWQPWFAMIHGLDNQSHSRVNNEPWSLLLSQSPKGCQLWLGLGRCGFRSQNSPRVEFEMSRRSRRLDVTDLKELVSKNLLLVTGATLVVTGATLVVTGATLVVTRSY